MGRAPTASATVLMNIPPAPQCSLRTDREPTQSCAIGKERRLGAPPWADKAHTCGKFLGSIRWPVALGLTSDPYKHALQGTKDGKKIQWRYNHNRALSDAQDLDRQQEKNGV